MNTDPLTFFPVQQDPGNSMKAARANERSWREMILNQEMDFIWHKLANLVQSQGEMKFVSGLDLADKTQDLFLRLLCEQRLNSFVDERWSEKQINRELLSLMHHC